MADEDVLRGVTNEQWAQWAGYMVGIARNGEEGRKIVCEYLASIVQSTFGHAADAEYYRVSRIAIDALMWLGQPEETKTVLRVKTPFQYDLTKKQEG